MKQKIVHGIFELLWWLITALMAYMVVSPIDGLLIAHPFWVQNVVWVVVFVTLTRYVFLLKYNFFAKWLPFKLLLLFGSLPLLIYLLSGMFDLQIYLNEEGVDGFVHVLRDLDTPVERVEDMFTYFRREMLFFGTGSIIITVLTPFRMLISVWRVYNKTGNV